MHDSKGEGGRLADVEVGDVPSPASRSSGRRVFLGASLMVVALNLRPLFSSFGAVLPEIAKAQGLSSAEVSGITTLPVLCLGLFAPFAPLLARRLGAERAILLLMILLTVGTATRAFGSTSEIIAGTVLAGAAIAVVNVLLPGLIKRDFADRAGVMAGLYTMALCAGAALAAGITAPLEHVLGSWQRALAFWTVPATVAVACWFFHVPPKPPAGLMGRTVVLGLWRCPLAWQVTAFMALQSMLSFTVFGWLAPILRDRGMPSNTAGLMVSISVLCQMLACLVAPVVASKLPHQRWLNAAAVIVAVGGFLGCLFAPPSTLWLWAVVQGLGQGALTSMGLTLIVLRSQNSHIAAQLSSMVQAVGYGVGAAGPLLVGILHGWTGGFASVGLMFAGVGVLAVCFGIQAGRSLYVKGVLHESRASEQIMTVTAQ